MRGVETVSVLYGYIIVSSSQKNPRWTDPVNFGINSAAAPGNNGYQEIGKIQLKIKIFQNIEYL